jgi:ferredoxin-NADP reductase
MVSPKTSRSARRRSVLLASGFGITPIAVDLALVASLGPNHRDPVVYEHTRRNVNVSDYEPITFASFDRDASLF